MISIISALSKNNVIGVNNSLPWDLPKDLKNFSDITRGKAVVMGRKTYESIFNKLGKPLPERDNIILTRQEDFKAPGCKKIKSLIDLLDEKNEIFIIGGAEVYKLAIPLADKMYLTHVETEIPGDTYFPEFDKQEWNITHEEKWLADEKNEFNCTFTIYERKK